MKNNPYVGKIGHGGTMKVSGNAASTPKGNGAVKKGTDLRTGSGSKKGC